jgi:hypothetical protein
MRTHALVICLGLLAIGAVSAQETSRFAFRVGAGFTTPVGNTGRQLDGGWNVGGGFGMSFSPYVGALIDLDYNSFGINSGTLAAVSIIVIRISQRLRSEWQRVLIRSLDSIRLPCPPPWFFLPIRSTSRVSMRAPGSRSEAPGMVSSSRKRSTVASSWANTIRTTFQ